IIAMYMESVSDGRQFFESMPQKPVIILKSGKTPLGERAAASHTGAMATNHSIFAGAARQHGAILADTFEEFRDIIRIMEMQPLPEGGGVGMVTNGAGPCVIAADHIHGSGNLSLPDIDASGLSEIPPFAIRSNPLDLTGSATAEHFLEGIRAMERDDSVDIIMPFFVFQDAPLMDSLHELHEGLGKMEHKKPIVALGMGGKFVEEQRDEMAKYGIPLLDEPAVAISSLDKIAGYSRWKNESGGSR
ncbi:MAG: hypothetical protein J7L93_02765, partial [Thermoplasmata archaeon]|nr:hypothetical protein [Thermoplasmata archaeon]